PALGVPQAGARVRATRASAKWLGWLAAAAVVVFLIGRLGSVVVEVHPEDARVRAPGALSLHLGGRLWVSPGPHRVRAEREGYLAAEAALVVHRGGAERLRLVLAKLPGQLQIDTAGVVAAVSIDGVAAGLAPGVIGVPAGERTISLRAPRYVDYTTTLGIEGAGGRGRHHRRNASRTYAAHRRAARRHRLPGRPEPSRLRDLDAGAVRDRRKQPERRGPSRRRARAREGVRRAAGRGAARRRRPA